jgi:hypothetical protein
MNLRCWRNVLRMRIRRRRNKLIEIIIFNKIGDKECKMSKSTVKTNISAFKTLFTILIIDLSRMKKLKMRH